MKIALIADIQGNALALQTALQHITSPPNSKLNHIISLGDIASGSQPKQVIQLLQDFECLMIMGNMDAVILDPEPYQGVDESERKFSEMDAWCHAQLSQSDKDYMRNFQSSMNISLDENTQLLACHGSPTSYDDVLVTTTSDNDLAPHFPTDHNTILAVGHMHESLLRRFRNHWLINPGSIGLPHAYTSSGEKSRHPLIAEYAMLTFTNGNLSAAFHQIPYDPILFKQQVLQSGMPHATWFLDQWQLGK